jgi:hypothetical protein
MEKRNLYIPGSGKEKAEVLRQIGRALSQLWMMTADQHELTKEMEEEFLKIQKEVDGLALCLEPRLR